MPKYLVSLATPVAVQFRHPAGVWAGLACSLLIESDEIHLWEGSLPRDEWRLVTVTGYVQARMNEPYAVSPVQTFVWTGNVTAVQKV